MANLLSNEKMVIIMVGLPARGKSYMAKKIFRYLRHLGMIVKVFNFGSYRRTQTKNTTVGQVSAKFFDPKNTNAVQIREQCCLDAMKDYISWCNSGGEIGILDGTNTTTHRRQLIRDFFFNKRSELEYNVTLLHVESICHDESVIYQNIISVKLKNPDYCTVDAQKAIHDFQERIKNYAKVYVPVSKDEGSYIKVVNVGTEVTGYYINDYISCRILYFLMHLHLHLHNRPKTKPLLLQIKQHSLDKTKQDRDEKMRKIAAGIGAKFTPTPYDAPKASLRPWQRRPSYSMWNEAEDTYKKEKEKKGKAIPEDSEDSPNASNVNVPSVQINSNIINEEHEVEIIGNDPFSPIKSNNNPISPNLINKSKSNGSVSIVTTMSPIVNSNKSSPPFTPTMRRPKVRKSEFLSRLLSTRNVKNLQNMAVNIKNKPNINSNLNTNANSGYFGLQNSETDNTPHDSNQNSETDNQKCFVFDGTSDQDGDISEDADFPDIAHKISFEQIKNNNIDKDKENEIKEDVKEEYISCELCGREVPISSTNEINSKYDPNEILKVCDICLYETDSEDDTVADDSLLDAMNIPDRSEKGMRPTTPTIPAFVEQKSLQQCDALNDKLSALINKIDINKNTNNDISHDDIKSELIKLQNDMSLLLGE